MEAYDLHNEKTRFLHMQKKNTQIRAFVFATSIVQYLYFLNPKLQGSSHILLCAARFMSDLVVNFVVTRLILYKTKQIIKAITGTNTCRHTVYT